jgi:hypothetical protein
MSKYEQIRKAFGNELDWQRKSDFPADSVRAAEMAIDYVARSFNTYLMCPAHPSFDTVVVYNSDFIEEASGFRELKPGIYANAAGVISCAIGVCIKYDKRDAWAGTPIRLRVVRKKSMSKPVINMWTNEWPESHGARVDTSTNVDTRHDHDLFGFYDTLAKAIMLDARAAAKETVAKEVAEAAAEAAAKVVAEAAAKEAAEAAAKVAE